MEDKSLMISRRVASSQNTLSITLSNIQKALKSSIGRQGKARYVVLIGTGGNGCSLLMSFKEYCICSLELWCFDEVNMSLFTYSKDLESP